MVKQTNENGLTEEELISQAIGIAATHLIGKGLTVTARGLLQFLKQEEEKTDVPKHKEIYRAARGRVLQKMQ